MKAVIIIVLSLAVAKAQGAEECSSLNQLQWLEGTWYEQKASQENTSTEKPSKQTVEQWTVISPYTLKESGSVIERENKTHIESLRIVKMSGEVFYIAKVKHNSLPIPFKLMKCSDDQYFFENQNHDFPKRIDYYKIDEKTMRVKVSEDGVKGFEILFSKN